MNRKLEAGDVPASRTQTQTLNGVQLVLPGLGDRDRHEWLRQFGQAYQR